METKHLDLHVPKGWQMCSTRELEMIAEEMIRSQMMASLSRFHPFDWTEIKTRLFFRFSGVEIVSQYVYDGDETDARYGNTTFVCRHPSLGKETFELQTWQVHSFMEQLAWLDATDAKGRALPMSKLMWPYPTRLRRWWPMWKREYYAPGEKVEIAYQRADGNSYNEKTVEVTLGEATDEVKAARKVIQAAKQPPQPMKTHLPAAARRVRNLPAVPTAPADRAIPAVPSKTNRACR